MAKAKTPLLSMGASGSVGKSMTLGKWRGVNYVRQHVVPANPNTSAQQAVRNIFRWIGEYWAYAPVEARTPWIAYARGKSLTDRNAQIKFNMPALQGETTIDAMIFSPPVLGGPPPASLTASGGANAGQITASAIPSTIPQGWTITRAQFVALPQQDPGGLFIGPVAYAEDATSPYSVTLTGLPPNTQCVVAVWFELQRDDGRLAYGTSLSTTATSGS